MTHDVDVPIFFKNGERVDIAKRIHADILRGLKDGKTVIATVLAAGCEERVIQVKLLTVGDDFSLLRGDPIWCDEAVNVHEEAFNGAEYPHTSFAPYLHDEAEALEEEALYKEVFLRMRVEEREELLASRAQSSQRRPRKRRQRRGDRDRG